MSKSNLTDRIEEYSSRLQKRLPLEAVILFGSHARGDAFEWSDIDLAVISPAFEDMSRIRRIGLLLEAWHAGGSAELLGFTPEEISRLDHPFIWEIVADGIAVSGRPFFQKLKDNLAQRIAEGKIRRIPNGWDWSE